ncbi:WD40 repeat domain-containing protein [Streptosporangium sp. NPDC087985]|uniref:WD40 repeat domain-containing protein n=1 Tax=Streptosporangium sp. NPDC087985 TaxID=3366196 RepID=UPI00381EE865
MRVFRRSALLIGVLVVVMGSGAPVEADMAVEATGPSVRYAGMDGCVCAPWTLWTWGGQVIKLTDARVFAGKAGKQPAPLALSPDGGYIAYFRREDGALVIRDMSTGGVREVPGVQWSRQLRSTRIDLAPAGRYVVLGSGQADRVLNARNGRSSAVPPGLRPWSFSPDAKLMLAVDDEFRAGIYSTATLAEKGRVPVGGALSPDGTTVAYFTSDDSAIGLWNVAAGRSGARQPIALPAAKIPIRLRWDGDGHLDLQMVEAAGNGDNAVYSWYRLDQGSGVAQPVDTFTVPDSVRNPIVSGLSP